jgi:hypothetical protein
MGKPYSRDLRERVIAAVDTGTGPPEPSKRSSQQSPKLSPKSVRKSAKTTLLTKAIAANYESALARLVHDAGEILDF